jgi:hypothetical protein
MPWRSYSAANQYRIAQMLNLNSVGPGEVINIGPDPGGRFRVMVHVAGDLLQPEDDDTGYGATGFREEYIP